jgi:hypothetical protein
METRVPETAVVVRVFEDVGGFYFCDDSLDYLDARGPAFPTRAAATRAAIAGQYDTDLERVPADDVWLTGSGVSRQAARVAGAHTYDVGR